MTTKAGAKKQKHFFFNIYNFLFFFIKIKNKKLKYILFNTKPFIK